MVPHNFTVGHKDCVSKLLNNMGTFVLVLNKFLIIGIIITTATL